MCNIFGELIEKNIVYNLKLNSQFSAVNMSISGKILDYYVKFCFSEDFFFVKFWIIDYTQSNTIKSPNSIQSTKILRNGTKKSTLVHNCEISTWTWNKVVGWPLWDIYRMIQFPIRYIIAPAHKSKCLYHTLFITK